MIFYNILKFGLELKIDNNDFNRLEGDIKQKESIIELNHTSTDIIKNKFSATIKDSAFEFDNLKDSQFEKGFHSLVLYTLGVKMYEQFGIFFKEKLDTLPNVNNSMKNHKEKYWFEYIWRLASFYHDVMTKYEKTSHSIPCVFCPFLTVENYLKYYCNFNIQYTVFSDYWCLKKIIKDYSRSNKLFNHKNIYNEEIVNRYFRKRLGKNNLDHGILSGYVFYNQLVNNYLKKSNNQHIKNYKDGSFDIKNEYNKIIKYRPVHLSLFKYIADAIITHNIWHYKPEEKEEYSLWGLEMLSSNNKLSIKKNPLAFMLGLLDTIEPTKYFSTIKPFEVLSSIDIECSKTDDGYFKIVLSKPTNSNTIDFDDWYNHKLKDMTCWLDLAVVLSDNKDSITITIANPKEKSPSVKKN